MRTSERLLLAVGAAASLILRAVAFFRYRFDSDEPQHLHVAWGWTAGLVQYRDYFDNHAPLFHLATAPLLAALGERADVLLYMRAAMLPLFVVVVACTAWLGWRLHSARVGLWGAVLLSLLPPFFLKSLEYRTDNLWNTFAVGAFVVFVGGRPSAWRWFFGGLLLGCAAGVSLKTPLLVLTLAGAGLIVRHLTADRTPVAGPLAAALAGIAVVPATLAAVLVHLHAWPAFLYCAVRFNELVESTRPHSWLARLLWPLLIALIIAAARRARSTNPLRLFCWVALAVYFATLVTFWVLISPRDMLPALPLAAVLLTGWADQRPRRLAIYASTAAVFVLLLLHYTDRLRNRTGEFITMMNQTLRLTRPGELLMDIKGETIYRRRPVYFIYELITREAMFRGLLPDRVADVLPYAHCYVAQADGPMFPPRARAFLNANFVDLGRLRAAGQWIPPDGRFTIAIPGPYVVVGLHGQCGGFLDGTGYTGRRDLGRGTHTFERTAPGERLAVLWAPAFERGFSPFHHRDLDFPR